MPPVKNAPKFGQPRTFSAIENEELVTLFFNEALSSLPNWRRQSLASHENPRVVLKKLELKPYRPRLLQHLSEDDPDGRLQFTDIILNEIRENEQLLG